MLTDLFKNNVVGKVAEIKKHDCWEYVNCCFRFGKYGTARLCTVCGLILEFRYKSFWKRFLRVFINFK